MNNSENLIKALKENPKKGDYKAPSVSARDICSAVVAYKEALYDDNVPDYTLEPLLLHKSKLEELLREADAYGIDIDL